ncbi:effector-associated constant component EACC1 [Allokutzneria multivorans]|uniref:effector-associated constant component EACC1 n=1 Tax=Allokutzneria multivorans TaxID=1142134 RepID=UPI0031EE8A60
MDDHPAVTISVRGTGTTDCLRSLRGWLVETGELRGPLHLGHQPCGASGPEGVVDVLVVATGTERESAVLASAVLSWLRHRETGVDLRLATAEGATVELPAERVRSLDEDGVRAESARLARALAPAVH